MASRKRKGTCKANISNGTDATKLIRENIKCPVCMEVLLPPIYQCETGHNICYTCVESVEECPLCREAIGDCRNFFAEELVSSMKFPCKYEDYGCQKIFLGSELKDHQENCDSQPYRCPELACQEVAGLFQMAAHLDKHGFKVIKGDFHEASFDVQDEHFDRKTEYNPWRLTAFNREFYALCTRQKDKHWYFWVWFLGPEKEAKKFSSEITVYLNENQVVYRGVCYSLRTPAPDLMKNNSCLILTDPLVKALRKEGKIYCRIRFIEGKNWEPLDKNIRTMRSSLITNAIPGTSSSSQKTLKESKTSSMQLKTKTSGNTTKASASSSGGSKKHTSPSSVNTQKPQLAAETTAKTKPSGIIAKKNSCVSNSHSSSASKSERAAEKGSEKIIPAAQIGQSNVGNFRTGKELNKASGKDSDMNSILPSRMESSKNSISDQENEFIIRMRNILRCSSCGEVISPPVHMCNVGHNLCYSCMTSRADCGLCRAPVSTSRNFFAEELLYQALQKCSYSGLGCEVCLPSAHMRLHEANCIFAPFECPFNTCRTMVSPRELFDHLTSHQIQVVDHSMRVKVPVPRHKPTVAPICMMPSIIVRDGAAFYPIVVHDTDGGWSFWVTSQEFMFHRYELLISRGSKTLAYQGPILSIRNSQDQIIQNGWALMTSDKGIKSLKQDDKIDLTLKVYRNEDMAARDPLFRSPLNLDFPNLTAASQVEVFASKRTSKAEGEDDDDDIVQDETAENQSADSISLPNSIDDNADFEDAREDAHEATSSSTTFSGVGKDQVDEELSSESLLPKSLKTMNGNQGDEANNTKEDRKNEIESSEGIEKDLTCANESVPSSNETLGNSDFLKTQADATSGMNFPTDKEKEKNHASTVEHVQFTNDEDESEKTISPEAHDEFDNFNHDSVEINETEALEHLAVRKSIIEQKCDNNLLGSSNASSVPAEPQCSTKDTLSMSELNKKLHMASQGVTMAD